MSATVHVAGARTYRVTETDPAVILHGTYLKLIRVVGAEASQGDVVQLTEDGEVFWETVADAAGFIDEILWENYTDGVLGVINAGGLDVFLTYK